MNLVRQGLIKNLGSGELISCPQWAREIGSGVVVLNELGGAGRLMLCWSLWL